MVYKRSIFYVLFSFILIFSSFSDKVPVAREKEIAIGIHYDYFFHLSNDINSDFTFFDVAGEMTFPVPFVTPLLYAGLFFIQENADSKYTWTHNNLYVKGGIQYVHHWNDSIRTGANITSGITWAPLEFPAGSRNLYNILADLEVFLGIKPISCISIKIIPALRYNHSLTNVKRLL